MHKNDKQNNKQKVNKFSFSNVLLISIAHLLHDTFSAFLSPVIPILIDKLNISLFQSSLLSIFQRLPALLNPLVGIIADKLNLRYLIIISPSITAVAMSLMGIAPNFWFLCVLLLIMGVGSLLFHVPSPVMIKKVSGNRTGMGMSFYMLGGEFARTLGPIVVLGAISLWTFEGIWRLIPVALFASLILYFRLKNIRIYKEFQKKKKSIGSVATLKKFLPLFLYIGFYIVFINLMKSALTFYLPTFFGLKGKSLWYGGIALSVFQFSGAAGTFVSGTISDILGRKPTLLIASIVNPILMFLFVFFNESAFSFVILIFIGFFMFASTPVLLAIVNELDSERPAFINSIYMTINFLFGTIPVLLIGGFSDIIGMEKTFYISSILAFSAIPFLFLIFRFLKIKKQD